MSKIDDAFEQVIGLAEKFKAILDVSEAVKEIGSLEQTISERTAARDAAVAEHEAVKSELEALKQMLSDARTSYADELSRQQQEIGAMRASAQASIERDLSDAKALAQSMVEKANLEVAKINQDNDAAMSEKRAMLNELIASINSAKQDLQDITDAYRDMRDRIDALKASAKSLLGG